MLRVTCIILLSICLIVGIIFIALLIIYPSSTGCKSTVTTASGFAITGKLCAGNLIFEEKFEKLDKHKWQPDVSFWGGGVSVWRSHIFNVNVNIFINFIRILNRTVNSNGIRHQTKTAL